MQKLIKLISAIKFLLLPVAIFLTLAILVLSLIKTDSMPKININQADKYFHGIAYFSLTAVWFLALYFELNKKKWSTYLFLLIAVLIYGTVIEVLQMTVTNYRSFDVYDILANFVGATLFFLVYIVSRRIYLRFQDK